MTTVSYGRNITTNPPGQGVSIDGLTIQNGEVGPTGVEAGKILGIDVSGTPTSGQSLVYNGTTWSGASPLTSITATPDNTLFPTMVQGVGSQPELISTNFSYQQVGTSGCLFLGGAIRIATTGIATGAAGSIAIGSGSSAVAGAICIGSSATSAGTNNVVLGNGSTCLNQIAITIGNGSSSGSVTNVDGICIGHNSSASSESYTIGNSSSSAVGCVLIGSAASATTYGTVGVGHRVAAGAASVAVGFDCTSGGSGVTVGRQAASGTSGVTVGRDGASGNSSVAVGIRAATGNTAVSVGADSSAETSSAAFGYQAIAQTGAIALGNNAFASSTSTVGIGTSVNASGAESTVVGSNTTVGSASCVVIGANSGAAASLVHIMGNFCNSNVSQSVLLGNGVTLSSASRSFGLNVNAASIVDEVTPFLQCRINNIDREIPLAARREFLSEALVSTPRSLDNTIQRNYHITAAVASQVIRLPDVTTVLNGFSVRISNRSGLAIDIETSTGNLIVAMPVATYIDFIVINAAGTNLATDWARESQGDSN